MRPLQSCTLPPSPSTPIPFLRAHVMYRLACDTNHVGQGCAINCLRQPNLQVCSAQAGHGPAGVRTNSSLDQGLRYFGKMQQLGLEISFLSLHTHTYIHIHTHTYGLQFGTGCSTYKVSFLELEGHLVLIVRESENGNRI